MAGLLSIRKIARDILSYSFGNKDFGLIWQSDAALGFRYPIDLDFALKDEAYFYGTKISSGFHAIFVKGRWHHVPSGIASFGLAKYNVYATTRDDESRKEFLNSANWFMQDRSARWRHDIELGEMKAPWYSCLAQGLGMSLLVRAYCDTKSADYLEQARRAADLLSLNVKDGGVLSQLDDGSPFLEEYPSRDPKHVLNGFLSALIGIHDLISTEMNPNMQICLAKFLDALENNIALWDTGEWSTYDADICKNGVRNFSTVSYHRLHTSQLRYLGIACKRERLMYVADRWELSGLRFRSRARALAGKVAYRLLAG